MRPVVMCPVAVSPVAVIPVAVTPVAAPMTEADRSPGRFVTTAMTMDFELFVDDDTIDPSLAADEMRTIGEDLRSIESTFSTFRPDSWVSRLNRGEVTLEECPAEVAEVLELCDHYTTVTGGAFNSVGPDGRRDPTGIVKTWAMERARSRIESLGARRWLWGCSGDAVVGSSAAQLPDTTPVAPWIVGVADPRVARSQAGPVDRVALDLARPAIATSGTSEHGTHIWGPAGRSPSTTLSATVIGADLITCDAWATALVSGGTDTAGLAVEAGLQCMLIAERGGQLVASRSSNWPRPPV